MTYKFPAFVIDEKLNCQIQECDDSFFNEGDVTVKIDYSALNYKDALAITGHKKIGKFFPMIAGAEFYGTVFETKNSDFNVGDSVVANGFGLSETAYGGYSRYQRLPAKQIQKKPDCFTLKQCAQLGIAGLTAALCIDGVVNIIGEAIPEKPVFVTGATGGVGSLAVILLKQAGYHVTAITNRNTESIKNFLTQIGADNIEIAQSEFDRSKPLNKRDFAAGVDVLGGGYLANLLARTDYGGAVSICGLAASDQLLTTVYPFILRAVSMIGIDSIYPPKDKKEKALSRLYRDYTLSEDNPIFTIIPPDQLIDYGHKMLECELTGRVVVDFKNF